jgi:hypothetical protein
MIQDQQKEELLVIHLVNLDNNNNHLYNNHFYNKDKFNNFNSQFNSHINNFHLKKMNNKLIMKHLIDLYIN